MRPSGSSQTWVTQYARRGAMSFPRPLLNGIAALPGRRYAICPRQRLSAFGSALQSCPALALHGKSTSLAVVSPYGAPMPHIGRLPAYIVTSPIAALHVQHHYAEAVPSHGAVFSEHCHFHVSHDERSHSVRVLPGLLCRRLDSNQRPMAFNRISICAIKLYRLSYACI